MLGKIKANLIRNILYILKKNVSKMLNKKPWLYNEKKHIGVDFDNPQEVLEYDKKQGVNLEQERKLLKKLGIKNTHVIIEYGPGTGSLCCETAKVANKVIAIDISQTMLESIIRKTKEQNIHNIELYNKGFLSYHHKDDPVDYIITKNALHHLPDFWKMDFFVRANHLLKLEGTLYLRDVIFSFEPINSTQYINNWIDKYSKVSGWSISDFETHIREEYSTYTWILEEMIKKAGFMIQEVNYDDSKMYAEYICIKKLSL